MPRALPAGTVTFMFTDSLSERLRLLVTSRGPLHASGEHLHRLEPLEPADAAELFVARATAAGGSSATPELVDAICARLDRLPLAIELAAARALAWAP